MLALISGCGGMLGSYIQWPNVLRTDIDTLDVTKLTDIKMYEQMLITHIVHLAAETDLEKCEREPERAYQVNALGTYNMVQFAKLKNIPIVYISTAGVFDGLKETAYTEDDPPNPVNMYGMTKYWGELIARSYPKHYIFRSGWMMGGGPQKEKKFVGKIIKKIKEGAKELRVINDIYGSPTYAGDLTSVINSALDNNIPYGTYHACNTGKASRYDVACEIIKIMKYDVEIIPVSQSDFLSKDKDHPCFRSINETMDMTKLNKNGITTRDWRTALEEYLGEWK